MSFGAAAVPRGFVRVAPHDPCPCGADRYDGCCGPLLDGDPAPTAERLMRSRYTAFVVGNTEHLRRTWHAQTRPAELTLDPRIRWIGLDVRAVDGGGVRDDTGTVEFHARWVDDGESGALREKSRFVRRGGHWAYLDGDVDENPAQE